MLEVYATFAEEWMAMPVIRGTKSANERFAGADDTLCIEAMMQDGKALQAGTSHFLGQNFAKAFDVQFLNKQNTLEHVWGTSWGLSTRMMGALVMAHSDDAGLVLPPKLAPIQVVIVPIYRSDEQLDAITDKVKPLVAELKKAGISVKYDNSDANKPGWKFAEYELRGVPVRLAMGARDLENGTVEIARRDLKTKETVPFDGLTAHIQALLDDIQKSIYQKALAFREANTFHVDTFDAFKEQIEKGGFIMAHWDGTSETEDAIKEQTKATIRCIPLNTPDEAGVCVYSGKPSTKRVVFARAY
jgi:prolyl-tRNA synthetase